MIKIVLTLDYEINGNGTGDPSILMVEHTKRLIDLCDKYNAKLTIFADIAEILAFKNYIEQHSVDLFCYNGIIRQLKETIKRGHDVQLHLHPSYMNARYDNQKWVQDYSEYDFANLNTQRMNQLISTAKKYLEDTLKTVNNEYKCIAFRAANWSVNPSKNIVRNLIANGIKIDTSIFKYGKRNDILSFDYSQALSNAMPWPVQEDNMCETEPTSQLYEFPIYAENRPFWFFISINRVLDALMRRHNSVVNESLKPQNRYTERFNKIINLFFKKHALKADLNKCTGKQLIAMLKRVNKTYSHEKVDCPFVLIGHSKLFNGHNEKMIIPFFKFVNNNRDCFAYSTFNEFDVNNYTPTKEL